MYVCLHSLSHDHRYLRIIHQEKFPLQRAVVFPRSLPLRTDRQLWDLRLNPRERGSGDVGRPHRAVRFL